MSILKVSEAALTITERLRQARFADDFAHRVDQHQACEWLKKWRSVIGSNGERFDKRLQFSGWTEQGLREALSIRRQFTSLDLPEWAALLERASCESAHYTDQLRSRMSNRENREATSSIPFQEALAPLANWARYELEGYGDEVSDEAWAHLQRNCLIELSNIAAPCLYEDFDNYRPFGASALSHLGNQAPVSRTVYREFCCELLSDGLLGFFGRWPVIARLLSTRLRQWIDGTKFTLNRIRDNDHELAQRFFGQKSLGPLLEVSHRLSDHHAGGGYVVRLRFASGSLYYKPKCMEIDSAIYAYTKWLRMKGAPIGFKAPKVLVQDGYGFAESIQSDSCSSVSQVTRYHQRAGALLAHAYVLGLTDCHYQNLIASGSWPVLIDFETTLHRTVKRDRTPDSGSLEERFFTSVLQTGLLPRAEPDLIGMSAFDSSGYGAKPGQKLAEKAVVWTAINTDCMGRSFRDQSMRITANLPRLKNEFISPSNYLKYLLTGFEREYVFLQRHRKEILEGPRRVLCDAPIRFVFRPTRVYSALLTEAEQGDAAVDGVQRSITLDRLFHALLESDDPPAAWPVAQLELEQMEHRDVPRFQTRPDTRHLWLFGETSPIARDFFEHSSSEALYGSLKKLSMEDAAFQRSIAEQSVMLTSATSWLSKRSPQRPRTPSSTTYLADEQLLQCAQGIAQEIRDRATLTGDQANWLGIGMDHLTGRIQLEPLGHTLYKGRLGVALFLSALDSEESSDQHYHLVSSCLTNLVKEVQDGQFARNLESFTKQNGIGAALGAGSIAYGLWRVGLFRQDTKLVDLSYKVIKEISKEMVARDDHLDVLNGSAGLALVLAAMATDDWYAEGFRELASAVVSRLKERAIATASAGVGWKGLHARPLAGFSHGAAGFALALTRLGHMLDQPESRQLAFEALQYENTLYVESSLDWADLRATESLDRFMGSWCNGAPGIGLARVGMSNASAVIDRDIQRAITFCTKAPLSAVDHCCCGNAGRLEFLIDVAMTHAACEGIARQLAYKISDSKKQRGNYSLLPNTNAMLYSPSFFQGTAGIGYSFLRLRNPDLPCVLRFE